MAEAVVVLVIKKIGEALVGEASSAFGSLLANEVSSLTQVEGRMGRIRSEFEIIQTFLSSIETRNYNRTIEPWLKRVREIAHRVEDVVDEYAYLTACQRRGHFIGFLDKNINRLIVAWHGISDRLKEIESDLEHASKMKERYIISAIEGKATSSSCYSSERQLHIPDSAHFIGEDEIVGVWEEREKLVEWLTDENPARYIISVWGMGGVGKTTLVTNVYKSQTIQKHFDCYAWVSVSQSYKTDDLLTRILKEFFGGKEVIPYESGGTIYRNLVETVRSNLQQKRYLVILDDVWSVDAWFEIDKALFDNKHGSRIVITTRNKDVASLAVENHILELQTLEQNEAWELFCKKSFSNYEDRSCPQEIESQAKKILEKCQGLPLAIVAIGSLMSVRGKEESEWRKVHDQLNWDLANNPDINHVSSILNLSYNDLPGYLKNCFLYCSIFPEDYMITRKKLIRLWVAEGFVERKGTQTMEEVAEDYLMQLIRRCMLQVIQRNCFGRVNGCRMHDLLRELTLSLARKERFSVICNNPEVENWGEQARRLSVHERGNEMRLSTSLSSLRSFVVYDTDFSSSILRSVSSGFRLLRVLDLKYIPIKRVPDAVFGLYNLHHLGLRETKVEKLPKSLGRLQNLQTLDLLKCNIKKLPRTINKLKKLRHLFMSHSFDQHMGTFKGVPAPKGICDLRALQTLKSVRANWELVRQLGKLTQLRNLDIEGVRSEHCFELCTSITKMHHLVQLGVVTNLLRDVLRLESLNPPRNLLQKLKLSGKLEEGVVESTLFHALTNLREFLLYHSQLEKDPLPSLLHMSNLVFILLGENAYNGKQLCFRSGWFPNLKTLCLEKLAQLNTVEIEEGAMKCMHKLFLDNLGELKVIPNGIEFLTTLQTLELSEMPKEFMERLGGEDKSKVQHIPKVISYIYQEGRWVDRRIT